MSDLKSPDMPQPNPKPKETPEKMLEATDLFHEKQLNQMLAPILRSQFPQADWFTPTAEMTQFQTDLDREIGDATNQLLSTFSTHIETGVIYDIKESAAENRYPHPPGTYFLTHDPFFAHITKYAIDQLATDWILLNNRYRSDEKRQTQDNLHQKINAFGDFCSKFFGPNQIKWPFDQKPEDIPEFQKILREQKESHSKVENYKLEKNATILYLNQIFAKSYPPKKLTPAALNWQRQTFMDVCHGLLSKGYVLKQASNEETRTLHAGEFNITVISDTNGVHILEPEISLLNAAKTEYREFNGRREYADSLAKQQNRTNEPLHKPPVDANTILALMADKFGPMGIRVARSLPRADIAWMTETGDPSGLDLGDNFEYLPNLQKIQDQEISVLQAFQTSNTSFSQILKEGYPPRISLRQNSININQPLSVEFTPRIITAEDQSHIPTYILPLSAAIFSLPPGTVYFS